MDEVRFTIGVDGFYYTVVIWRLSYYAGADGIVCSPEAQEMSFWDQMRLS